MANESKTVFKYGELVRVKPVICLYNTDNKNVAHVESAELRVEAHVPAGTTVRFDSRGQAVADRFSVLEPGESARFLTVLSVRPSDTVGIRECTLVLTLRDEKGMSRVVIDSVGRKLGELIDK